MKHLYFCRHGLSQLGKQGLWAGSTDTPLAPEGRDEAKLAGEAARKLNIEYIVCSPLSRAHETAKIIAAHIGYPENKIEINNLVVERDFGALEGTTWDPIFDVESIADAEPLDHLFTRARQTLAHLQTLNVDNILVVSHGAFGRALRHTLHPNISFAGDSFENAKIMRLL